MAFSNFRAAKAAACIGLLVSGVLLPTLSSADPVAPRTVQATKYSFNWLSNGKAMTSEELAAIILAQQIKIAGAMGDGSWICSPAGFGQRSRCYRN